MSCGLRSKGFITELNGTKFNDDLPVFEKEIELKMNKNFQQLRALPQIENKRKKP